MFGWEGGMAVFDAIQIDAGQKYLCSSSDGMMQQYMSNQL